MATGGGQSPHTHQRLGRLGAFVLALALGGLLAANAFFWYRYEAAKERRSLLADGSCEVTSAHVYESGWKQGWSFPIFGPKWTDVPCKVDLDIFDASGAKLVTTAPTNRTWLTFTYRQGVIWNVLTDKCRKLVPKQAKVGRFDCSFIVDGQGRVTREGVHVGKASSLPDLPKLLLLKALGFSVWTLTPLLLVLCCTLRGALRGQDQGTDGGYAALPSATTA